MKKIIACLVFLIVAGCARTPFAPERGLDGNVIRLSGDGHSGQLFVAVSEVSLSRAPLRVFFKGTWIGPLPGQTDHELLRSDLGGISTNDGGMQLQNYLNNTWFKQEFKDVNGQVTGYAWATVNVFTPQDSDMTLCIATFPITSCG